MALLMALNRKMYRASSRTKDANFSLDGLVGFDIHGKTVAVVGCGKVTLLFVAIVMVFVFVCVCVRVFLFSPVDFVFVLPCCGVVVCVFFVRLFRAVVDTAACSAERDGTGTCILPLFVLLWYDGVLWQFCFYLYCCYVDVPILSPLGGGLVVSWYDTTVLCVVFRAYSGVSFCPTYPMVHYPLKNGPAEGGPAEGGSAEPSA